MRRLLAAVLAMLALTGTGAATGLRPALWKVTGKQATVYLFGSVHVLSPKLDWRDARIGNAIDAADAFYFETSLDKAGIQKYVAELGALPPGQSLRASLPPDSQKDLDEDFAALGIREAALDTRRPWLVEATMVALKAAPRGTTPTGVDVSILADANARGKPVRYFETQEQQLALLVPSDPAIELKAFETFLKDFRHEDEDMAQLVGAWMHGDEARLGALIAKEYEKDPKARAAMFDDRNRAWTKTLEGVLDGETGTFFVTVGAGHLATERGVPALLKRDGYKVEKL